MPSKTIHFTDEMYGKILDKPDDQNVSERVRELVDKGIEVEKNE